jgi:hypothetical protein
MRLFADGEAGEVPLIATDETLLFSGLLRRHWWKWRTP